MIRESIVEKQAVEYAKSKKCLAIKLNDLTCRGAPDRLFILPSGTVLWVEFKASGEKLRLTQIHYHAMLKQRYQIVWVIDNFIDFKFNFDHVLKTTGEENV